MFNMGSKDGAKEFYLKGREYLRHGNFQPAIAEFEKALKENPDHKDAAFYKGYAWEKDGEIIMAQLEYQKAIEIDPFFKKAWERLYKLYEKMKNWEDFHVFFQKIYPSINKPVFKLWLLETFAVTYLSENKLKESEEFYKEILKLKPGYREGVLKLAKVYQLGEKDDEKSLEIMFRAFEIDDGDKSLVSYLARILRKLEKKDERALKVFIMAYKFCPEDENNMSYLKTLFFQRDEVIEPVALDIYNYFIDAGVTGELLFHRGLIWKSRNIWEKALEDFKGAGETGFSSEGHYPMFEAAYCYYRLNDYINCIDCLKVHLKNVPEHMNGWKMARKIYFFSDFQWKEGEDYLFAEKIVSLIPSDRLYFKLADYYLNVMKDFEKAEKLYFKLLKENPRMDMAIESLEKIYEQNKHWDTLSAFYSTQAELFSSEVERKIYYLYKLADLNWKKLKNDDRALEIFSEILSLDSDRTDVYIEIANLYMSKNNFQEAKKNLRIVLNKDILNEKAYSLMGKIFSLEGKAIAASNIYSILRLFSSQREDVIDFFASYSFPDFRKSIQWEKEDEELLVHKEEQNLLPLLAWSRIWCEKLYAPKISNEVLRNATLTSNNHRNDIKEMVDWVRERMGIKDIPSYVYYGSKSKFTMISCLASDESYLIFHEDFIKNLSERELLFLIAHELCHIKREHHFYFRIKERVLDWTLGFTSNMFFSKIPIPLPGIWKNWSVSKEKEELEFEKSLLGLDFTSDRYGLFFCGDIGSASKAIWKKYAHGKQIEDNVDFKKLLTSSGRDKEVVLRLVELWKFVSGSEYEMEVNPVVVSG